ncbi:MAG: MFS transporter [Chloroflexi bacterium]|nr:MFS transporter [Chloroflexota bacterium]
MRQESAGEADLPLGQGTWRSIEFQATVALAAMLTPLNSTMLAVGLPSIRSHFDVGVGEMTLLISVYLVAVAAMQPVSGRLGDAYGSIRMMMVGLVLLIAISAVSALATNLPMLILMRGLQGAATALVLPNGIAVLRKRTPSARLGTVLGMNGAALSIAAATGPVIGGALLLAGDWRLLFLVNVPLSVVAIAFLLRLKPDEGHGRETLHIDTPSLLALVAVFGSAVLIGSATRVENPAFLIAGGALLPLTVAAYWLRSRWGGSIVEFRFFGARNFRAAASSQGLTNLVMYSFLVSLPLYLVDLRGVSDQVVSMVLFSLMAAMITLSPVGGALTDRVGRRPLLLGGGFIIGVATVAMMVLFDDPPLAAIIGPLIGVGIGLGISGPARSSAALEAWPRDVAGSVSGTFSMMRYAGAILGAAIIAALLGPDPGEGAFRLLTIVLAGVAILNIFVSLEIRDRPKVLATGAIETPTPVPERPRP